VSESQSASRTSTSATRICLELGDLVVDLGEFGGRPLAQRVGPGVLEGDDEQLLDLVQGEPEALGVLDRVDRRDRGLRVLALPGRPPLGLARSPRRS
jgi:hypothetical protein